MQPNNRPNGDQTPGQAIEPIALTIADAADRLGMTSEAVRMRLKRGTLSGAKVDGHWVVYLPAIEQPPAQGATGGRDRSDEATARDRTADPTATQQPPERDQISVVAVYQSLVASQREEIAFLREQLDKRSQELADERERSDVLHREAFARIEALTAGAIDTEDGEDDESADDSRKSAIEQESHQTRDAAPGRANPSDMESESNEAAQDSRGGRIAGLWDWLTGR
jgi:hypothetical protein